MGKLMPVDKNQCQGEHRKITFMTMGGGSANDNEMIRCKNKPVVIATERRKGKDGKKGGMSLCNDCWKVATIQLGEKYFTIKQI